MNQEKSGCADLMMDLAAFIVLYAVVLAGLSWVVHAIYGHFATRFGWPTLSVWEIAAGWFAVSLILGMLRGGKQ